MKVTQFVGRRMLSIRTPAACKSALTADVRLVHDNCILRTYQNKLF